MDNTYLGVRREKSYEYYDSEEGSFMAWINAKRYNERVINNKIKSGDRREPGDEATLTDNLSKDDMQVYFVHQKALLSVEKKVEWEGISKLEIQGDRYKYTDSQGKVQVFSENQDAQAIEEVLAKHKEEESSRLIVIFDGENTEKGIRDMFERAPIAKQFLDNYRDEMEKESIKRYLLIQLKEKTEELLEVYLQEKLKQIPEEIGRIREINLLGLSAEKTWQAMLSRIEKGLPQLRKLYNEDSGRNSLAGKEDCNLLEHTKDVFVGIDREDLETEVIEEDVVMILQMVAFFHDIGKGILAIRSQADMLEAIKAEVEVEASQWQEFEAILAREDHEEISRAIASMYLSKMGFSEKEITLIIEVMAKDKIGQTSSANMTDGYLKEATVEQIDELMLPSAEIKKYYAEAPERELQRDIIKLAEKLYVADVKISDFLVKAALKEKDGKYYIDNEKMGLWGDYKRYLEEQTAEKENLAAASILDPLAKKYLGENSKAYWYYTIWGASIWETLAFTKLGYVGLIGNISIQTTGFLWLSLGFSLAHVIVNIWSKVRAEGWEQAFNKNNRVQYLKSLKEYSMLGAILGLPFILLGPSYGAIVSIILHALINTWVLRNRAIDSSSKLAATKVEVEELPELLAHIKNLQKITSNVELSQGRKELSNLEIFWKESKVGKKLAGLIRGLSGFKQLLNSAKQGEENILMNIVRVGILSTLWLTVLMLNPGVEIGYGVVTASISMGILNVMWVDYNYFKLQVRDLVETQEIVSVINSKWLKQEIAKAKARGNWNSFISACEKIVLVVNTEEAIEDMLRVLDKLPQDKKKVVEIKGRTYSIPIKILRRAKVCEHLSRHGVREVDGEKLKNTNLWLKRTYSAKQSA